MEEKEKSLKILAVQMSSKVGDVKSNYLKVLNLIEKNIKNKPDIVILPEVWTVGWMPSVFTDSAESIEDNGTIKFLSDIAKKYSTNIIGGSFITKSGDKYYNTCPVINRQGELIATYNKMHLYSYYGCDEGKFITVGNHPVMVEIDGVKIGLTICYDIRFPELYRAYRKAGVDLLVNVAAWGLHKEIPWEVLTKARAVENQCYMVAITQSGKIAGKDWNLGHSRIISYDGATLSEIGVGDVKETSLEGVMFADIKFNEMYKFREKCTVLLDIHDRYDVK